MLKSFSVVLIANTQQIPFAFVTAASPTNTPSVHRTFFAALISSHCFDSLFDLCSSSCPLGEQGWSLNVLCLMEMGMAYEGGWWGSYRVS